MACYILKYLLFTLTALSCRSNPVMKISIYQTLAFLLEMKITHMNSKFLISDMLTITVKTIANYFLEFHLITPPTTTNLANHFYKVSRCFSSMARIHPITKSASVKSSSPVRASRTLGSSPTRNKSCQDFTKVELEPLHQVYRLRRYQWCQLRWRPLTRSRLEETSGNGMPTSL
jgi:hypothetical protein